MRGEKACVAISYATACACARRLSRGTSIYLYTCVAGKRRGSFASPPPLATGLQEVGKLAEGPSPGTEEAASNAPETAGEAPQLQPDDGQTD